MDLIFKIFQKCSGISLTVPHPVVFWQCLNSMGAQKNAPQKVIVTLSPYIFRIKAKRNIV